MNRRKFIQGMASIIGVNCNPLLKLIPSIKIHSKPYFEVEDVDYFLGKGAIMFNPLSHKLADVIDQDMCEMILNDIKINKGDL